MQPLLTSKQTRRVQREPESLLTDVLDGINSGPIYERQIREDGLFVFGAHDTDGSITLNVPLLRVLVFLHEGLHRARPSWSERTVRGRSLALLHQLDDDAIGAVNKQLVKAIRTPGCRDAAA